MRGNHELRQIDDQRVLDRLGAGERGESEPQAEAIDLAELLVRLPPEQNLHRWQYAPDERVQIVRSLLVADGSPWIGRFAFLLAMSVVIASLGLANDQPAAVIAAMVVAPMMTPVLGIAASVTMGLVHQTLRLTAIVTVASLLAVLFGWMISASLVVQELTGEELSRTSPRLRDLAIALAAGAAGMYSVVRKDLSGVVPGVAIAVALVPPLATIGILLDLQEWSLARGAALLYATNVLAIIVSAVIVLLVTDFMPSPPASDPKVLAVGAATVVACIAVVVPVWRTSRQLDREVRFSHDAQAAIDDWSSSHPDNRIVTADITPDEIDLVISGDARPEGLDALQVSLAGGAFPATRLHVEWMTTTPIVIDG